MLVWSYLTDTFIHQLTTPMLFPIKVVDIELTNEIPTFEHLDGYLSLQALVRLHGIPLGYIQVPVTLGTCQSETISRLILEQHANGIIRQLLRTHLISQSTSYSIEPGQLTNISPPQLIKDWPQVTVAVCTRDRPDNMRQCLDAINRLDYCNLEVLVVDNTPSTDETKRLITNQYSMVRYVCEPRPGLDWARNRAILEAKGEIIAFTDDDVVVDSGWVRAIAEAFVEDQNIMAVTGLVVPFELETKAQVLFEKYGGFGRGFERKAYKVSQTGKLPWRWLGAGQFGTGANMAFRRSVFAEIGFFDPALDVGTCTSGGGDLEMYIRVLKAGYTLVYDPKAIIRHRHRRAYPELKRQISFNGSLYALWSSIAATYREERISCFRIAVWWMCYWNIRRLIVSALHQTRFPRDLILAEFLGAFKGLTAYPKARRYASEVEKRFGWQHGYPLTIRLTTKPTTKAPMTSGIAVRQVELSQPLEPLANLEAYEKVRIFVSWHNSPFGSFDYSNSYCNVSVITLSHLLVKNFGHRLLDPTKRMVEDKVWAEAVNAIAHAYKLCPHASKIPLPHEVTVSIVVATSDRPADLRNCLQHLIVQQTDRPVEIVVVDNHPSSGLTQAVVSEFPSVVLVEESRQGLAYARNAGFVASKGEILVATDDDVTVPPDWLEKLVQPFGRADVMVVTGNVLPLELDNKYQQAFENYGGLGRGFDGLEVDGNWYDLFFLQPPPTWSLGATANAAFRASVFSEPDIGLMDECLGPGMPSGVGEDTYLFYKVIKAGYTLIYNPDAFVWHKHRCTERALRRQLYGYSKGHVSYNLTTWMRDGDWRGLVQVLFGLPYGHYYRIKEYLLRKSDYPISLILLELLGNLAGPWSLWRSRQLVKRRGHSDPFRPDATPENSKLGTVAAASSHSASQPMKFGDL